MYLQSTTSKEIIVIISQCWLYAGFSQKTSREENELTQWRKVVVEKLIVGQLVKKYPTFMEPECSYHVHKRPPPALSWARKLQSTPSRPVSLRFILILSTHIRWDLPRGLVPSGCPAKILNKLLIFPIHATCPICHIMLHFIILFGEKCKLWSFSLCSFLQPLPLYSS
jgi:hypothetical protein